jgi:hypothetical protein
MSNIVVVIKQKKLDVSVLGELHKLLGGSLVKIRTALLKSAPVIEMELFDGEYEGKAKLLRKMIDCIRRNRILADIYEIPSGATFAKFDFLQESLISLDVLENILDSSDDEMKRQLDM